MTSDSERQKIMIAASKEIRESCKKHGVHLTAENNVVFVNHHENHENGDVSVRAVSLAT